MIVDKMIEALWDAVHPDGLGSNDCEKIEAALRASLRMALSWNEYYEWQCSQAKTSEELEGVVLVTKQMRKAFEAFQDATSV